MPRYPNSSLDVRLYKHKVGKLLYTICTCINIPFATCMTAIKLICVLLSIFCAIEHILCYLSRYPSLSIYFVKGEENHLQGYNNANYARDVNDHCSIGAYFFVLKSTYILWSCKKQSTTSRSSCEFEYRALSNYTNEAI